MAFSYSLREQTSKLEINYTAVSRGRETDIISTANFPVETQLDFVAMALPTEIPMPSYFIYRDTAEGQCVDPTAPLVFWPPKDSDELFDALRAKYPHLRTHSERMREVVIEFLLEEQQVPQLPTEELSTPQMTNSTTTSPWQASMQSMSSGSSTWSSPEIFDLATPTFGNSPQPQTQQLSRQLSTATTATIPNNPTPPALENMTGVFSLSDSTQPKQRVRRKMTEAEKVEYRKRRIVKACDKCAKRKRKCHHNQPEMETISTANSHKVTKLPATPGSKKQPSAANVPPRYDPDAIFGASVVDFSDSFGSDVPMQQVADYSALPEDTLPEMSLDDLLVSNESYWPWSDSQDWTLMDPSADAFAPMHVTNKTKLEHEHELPQPKSEIYDQTMQDLDDILDFNDTTLFPSGSGYNGNDGMLWENLHTGQVEKPRERQQPTHTAHVHDADGIEMSQLDRDSSSLWLGTGQDLQESQNPNANRKGERGPRPTGGKPKSLAQLTLRLTGTAKAVKAFGNLLQSSSPRLASLRTTSLTNVAGIAFSAQSQTEQGTIRRETGGRTHGANQPCDVCCESFTFSKDMNRHMKHRHNRNTQQGLLESMSMDDYLRMQTNRSPVQEDGRAVVSGTPQTNRTQQESGAVDSTANVKAYVHCGALSKALGGHPSPGSSGVKMQQHTDSTAQQGRPTPSLSLGEGIATSKSPSTQLFMLKRRIPNALHSVGDWGSPATSLGPLLRTIPDDVQTQTQRDHEREMVVSRNTECTGGNATLVNGGAYQRLHAAKDNKPIVTAGLGSIANADNSVRFTRANVSTGADSTGDHNNGPGSGSTGLVIEARKARVLLDVHSIDAKMYNELQSTVYHDRLMDHMRRRDHFGRHTLSSATMGTLVSIAALATLLIIVSLLATTTTNLSLLLLALASPVPGAKGTLYPRSRTMLWDNNSNSSWLTYIDEASAYFQDRALNCVSRLLYRGCWQDNGYNAGSLSRNASGKKDGPSGRVVAV